MKLFNKLFKGEQANTSIPDKKEIPEKRKEQFTGIWDARRLLHELLRITQSVKGWKIELCKTDSEQTPYKVRYERVLSVINAFMGYKVIDIDRDYIPLDILIPENYSEMKMLKLTSLIVDFLPKYETRIEDAFNQDREYTSRMQLFSLLFRYRLETYKLSTYWNNVSETDIVGGIAIDMTEKLYNEKIESINETLDKLLLFLLGDGFDKTFTERELLEEYDYPNVTDEKLHEMELEYC